MCRLSSRQTVVSLAHLTCLQHLPVRTMAIQISKMNAVAQVTITFMCLCNTRAFSNNRRREEIKANELNLKELNLKIDSTGFHKYKKGVGGRASKLVNSQKKKNEGRRRIRYRSGEQLM